MRYIHSGSGRDLHLPRESLCLFLCRFPRLRSFCYIIGLRRSELRETAWVEEYLPKTATLIAKHGGKVLIGGNAPRALMALEGEAKPPLSVVVLEFPSLAHTQAFHNDPDYAPLKQLRQANIAMEVFVVEPV
jgi:uncharacterized protein (DUF1330 family)